jgi:hypothetical protein
MTDEDQVTYGREATAVLGNKAYRDAYEHVEAGLINELAKVEIAKDRAEYLRQMLTMGRMYRKYFEKAMADGKFAAESIKLEAERRKWFSRAA